MVKLIQLFLLLVDVADHCQLYLTDESLPQLCVDEDISSAVSESILDADDLEGVIRIITHLVESANEVYDLALLRNTLTSQQVEHLKVN